MSHVTVKKYMGAHPYQTRLSVGVQHFDVGPRYETAKEAEWYAKQLRHALSELVKEYIEEMKPREPAHCEKHLSWAHDCPECHALNPTQVQ